MLNDIYVIKFKGYDNTAGYEKTYYYCTGEGYDDPDPSIPCVKPRVKNPGVFTRRLFARGKIIGLSSAGFGECRLNNAEQDLNELFDIGLDGRSFWVYRLQNTNLQNSELVFSGTIESAEFTTTEIVLNLKNELGEFFKTPIVTDTFSGDTTDTTYGASGHVNGTPEDWAGKYKPLLVGNGGGENFSPPMVNTAKQTFMISLKEIEDISNVWMNGSSLTKGTKHASLTALQAASVTVGEYDYYVGDGVDQGAYFRVGSGLDGQVTCKAYTSSTSTDITMAQNVNSIFTAEGKTISASSITSLDSLNSYPCGYWVSPNGEDIGTVVGSILGGDAAFIITTPTNEFELGLVTDPSAGVSIYDVEEEILLGNANKVKYLSPIIPASNTKLEYRINYTVQSEGELAGIVGSNDARVLFLKNKWRTKESGENSSVLTKHLTATPITLTSYFSEASDAQAVVDRLAVLFEQQQEFIEISVDVKYGKNFSIANIVKLKYNITGDGTYYNYLVTEQEYNFKTNVMKFVLWRVKAL